MKSTFSILSLLLLLLFSTQISYANTSSEALARRAVSENAAEASPAIEELRTLGPAGLKTLMDQYRDEIRRHVANPSLASDEQWQRISTALDTVAQQKNSYIAGLYWHTDLNEARKASAAENKPILSLRLLGKLTDDFSCANSRFFRTVLYANADVSKYLRQNYVLHWESVRPVPRVTIDYGDGRKLERTLTGNSIHYILDSQARPIEALPGLYGPQAFLGALVEAKKFYQLVDGKEDTVRNVMRSGYSSQQHHKIASRWATDVQRIGGNAPKGFTVMRDGAGQAWAIAPRAVTKMVIEMNVLREMTSATEELGKITDEAAWRSIAKLHSSEAVLDAGSISLIKHQNPALSEEELASLLRNFQELIALDTVRNDYLLRTQLYTWLMSDPARDNVQQLNEKVYASLFKTPHSDPWLGLFSAEAYTALDNGGVVIK